MNTTATNKVTSSIINNVTIKRWNDNTNEYDVMTTIDNMLFSAFINYLDNISTIAEAHWSVDYLNLGYTRTVVYLEF